MSQEQYPSPGTPVPPTPAAPPDAGPKRTHPITPLVSGWKVIAAVAGVITVQNIAQLAQEFTVGRALILVAALIGVLIIAVIISAIIWWRTTYEITDTGVTLRHGLLTLTRRTAPREKIESVSVERPFLARILGLSKVRVEIAGGSDSYLDIAYVRAAAAEDIRVRILQVAGTATGPAPSPPEAGAVTDQAGASRAYVGDATHSASHAPFGEVVPAPPVEGAGAGEEQHPGHTFVRDRLVDGVTDGELIARIPTARLLHSMVRDLGFVIGLGFGVVWVVAVVVLTIVQDELNFGFLAASLPAVIAVPQILFSRLESGWGFTARSTDRGLRMRRGLLNTRTDNLAPGRIQDVTLTRPVLWRAPGWTRARVTVAGIDATAESNATNALPVGDREELRRTLGHLLPPLGTDDDLETIEHLLTTPVRDLDGIGPTHRLFFLGRRTRRILLLPGAVVLRSGYLTTYVQIVPRERIQGMKAADGPVLRRTGSSTLTLGFAGASATVASVPDADAFDLHAALLGDAADGRRYARKDSWPRPPLTAAMAHPADVPADEDPQAPAQGRSTRP